MRQDPRDRWRPRWRWPAAARPARRRRPHRRSSHRCPTACRTRRCMPTGSRRPAAPTACDARGQPAALRPLPRAGRRCRPDPPWPRSSARGRLVVGVDQNTYLFGYRDATTGEIEGFDIDIAREVAAAIFGDREQRPARRDHVRPADPVRDRRQGRHRRRHDDDELRAVAAGQLLQPVLRRPADGAGPEGTRPPRASPTSAARRSAPRPAARRSRTSPPRRRSRSRCRSATGPTASCMLQQGQVDAISTDDTILAGLAAQDPTTQLVGAAVHRGAVRLAMRNRRPISSASSTACSNRSAPTAAGRLDLQQQPARPGPAAAAPGTGTDRVISRQEADAATCTGLGAAHDRIAAAMYAIDSHPAPAAPARRHR